MPLQNEAQIRSEALRDFISHRPGIVIRRGIPVFFIILVGLGASTFFIQYPDIVKASAKVSSINPPKQVIAKSSGRLIKLFKGDNGEVKQGEVIGYIESTASHDEVLKLSAIVDTLQYFTDKNMLEQIPRFWQSSNQPFAHLGELQQSHQAFMQDYASFKNYLSTGFYVAKKQMLGRDLNNTKKLLDILQQQRELQQQDLTIATENHNVHDTLHNETLITDIEYRNQKSQLINKKMSIPQVNASIISNQGQQNALLKEMLELDNQVAQQKVAFVQSLNTYRSQVEDWKQKYLLMAPISGTLSLAGFLEENQQLQTGETVCYITNKSSQYYVEMLVPRNNAGKIKGGQDVLLKFSSYPAQQYGSVKGRIEYIKNVPADSGYLAKVSLPEGLVTNYKKSILFQEGLLAQAEIITERKKLSDRFLSGFRNLFQ
ncbi:MAG: hypothetical protein SGI96_11380 [Bacteroidota bacterium]|nr:hypothetical protein [Bacteroidota bacterium]